MLPNPDAPRPGKQNRIAGKAPKFSGLVPWYVENPFGVALQSDSGESSRNAIGDVSADHI
jgi:hypothetical protein